MWRLVFNDEVRRYPIVFPPASHSNPTSTDRISYEWGVASNEVQSDLRTEIGVSTISVTRSGGGLSEEGFGYAYSIAFDSLSAEVPWKVETDDFGLQSRHSYFMADEGCTFKVSNLLTLRRLCTARGVDEKRRRN